MTTQTQVILEPPHNGGTAVACGFADDYIRDLGDRVAFLTLAEAAELKTYLERAYDL